MSEAPVETSSTIRRLAVAFPSILVLLIIWSSYRLPGVSADGVTYLQIARNIVMGKELGWQSLWTPPLHSALIAGTSYLTGVGDLLVAAGIVAPLMFFCLVPAVYFLALEIFDLRTALAASLFTALSPHLLSTAFSPEAEITYTFFLTLSLLLFTRAVLRSSAPYAIACGISFALAWMARSEGFVVMAFVFACATVVQGRQFYRSTIFRYCLLSTMFFMLAAAPYLLFLKEHYGSVVISPKSSYVMIWMKGRIYHDHNKGEMNNEELWGLTADGKKLRWQEPKGLSYLVDYLMSQPRKSLSVYLHNLGMELPGRIPNNSGMERYPQSFPVYFALASLLAVFTPWGSFPREKRAVLLAPLMILFVLPLFTDGWWKYLIPYFPLLAISASKGFSAASGMFAAKISPLNAARTSAMLLALTVSVIGARFLYAHPFAAALSPIVSSPSKRLDMAEEARKAGQWGAQRLGPGKNYIARWSKTIYYLDGFWTALPVANYEEMLAYARLNRADYLLFETVGEGSKDQPWAAPGLEFEMRYLSNTSPYSVDFYRVLPK